MNKRNFSFPELLQTLERQAQTQLSSRVKETLKLAYEGHTGQYRQTRACQQPVPYIAHPVGAAILVIKYFNLVKEHVREDMDTLICAALAHDLLEDTPTAELAIDQAAGVNARTIVDALTKPSTETIGKTKEQRNPDYIEQITAAGPRAVFVKLCDSMQNMSHPDNTPAEVFARAVSKAKSHYLLLLECCPLGSEFAQVYSDAVIRAETDAEELGTLLEMGTKCRPRQE